ncbi:MAG: hypothetical protein PHT57_02955 [Rhodoferax sp.]|nr:hypothetical protein [Rhodoferax sp.]
MKKRAEMTIGIFVIAYRTTKAAAPGTGVPPAVLVAPGLALPTHFSCF